MEFVPWGINSRSRSHPANSGYRRASASSPHCRRAHPPGTCVVQLLELAINITLYRVVFDYIIIDATTTFHSHSLLVVMRIVLQLHSITASTSLVQTRRNYSLFLLLRLCKQMRSNGMYGANKHTRADSFPEEGVFWTNCRIEENWISVNYHVLSKIMIIIDWYRVYTPILGSPPLHIDSLFPFGIFFFYLLLIYVHPHAMLNIYKLKSQSLPSWILWFTFHNKYWWLLLFVEVCRRRKTDHLRISSIVYCIPSIECLASVR